MEALALHQIPVSVWMDIQATNVKQVYDLLYKHVHVHYILLFSHM